MVIDKNTKKKNYTVKSLSNSIDFHFFKYVSIHKDVTLCNGVYQFVFTDLGTSI